MPNSADVVSSTEDGAKLGVALSQLRQIQGQLNSLSASIIQIARRQPGLVDPTTADDIAKLETGVVHAPVVRVEVPQQGSPWKPDVTHVREELGRVRQTAEGIIAQVKSEVRKAEDELNALRQAHQQHEAHMKELSAQVQVLSSRVGDIASRPALAPNDTVQKLELQLKAVENSKLELESQKAEAERRVQELQVELGRANAAVQSLKPTLETLSKELQAAREANESLQKQNADLQQQVDAAATDAMHHERLEADLNQQILVERNGREVAEKARDTAAKAKDQLAQENAGLKSTLTSITAEREQLEADLTKTQDRLIQVDNQLAQSRQTVEQIQAELDRTKREDKERRHQIEQLQVQLTVAQTQSSAAEKRFQELQARVMANPLAPLTEQIEQALKNAAAGWLRQEAERLHRLSQASDQELSLLAAIAEPLEQLQRALEAARREGIALDAPAQEQIDWVLSWRRQLTAPEPVVDAPVAAELPAIAVPVPETVLSDGFTAGAEEGLRFSMSGAVQAWEAAFNQALVAYSEQLRSLAASAVGPVEPRSTEVSPVYLQDRSINLYSAIFRLKAASPEVQAVADLERAAAEICRKQEINIIIPPVGSRYDPYKQSRDGEELSDEQSPGHIIRITEPGFRTSVRTHQPKVVIAK